MKTICLKLPELADFANKEQPSEITFSGITVALNPAADEPLLTAYNELIVKLCLRRLEKQEANAAFIANQKLEPIHVTKRGQAIGICSILLEKATSFAVRRTVKPPLFTFYVPESTVDDCKEFQALL